jgi:hypothetical protein
MFEPFKFKGMQYLAIPKNGWLHIISFIGLSYGLWESIASFKKAAPVNGHRFYKLKVE